MIFSEPACLLLAYVAMALGVAWDHGHFAWRALVAVTAGFVALALAARSRAAGAPRWPVERLMAAALVLLLVQGSFDAPGYHLARAGFRPVFVAVQLALAAAVALAWALPRAESRWRTGVLAAGLAAGFGLRVGIVWASPAPAIDVFAQFQDATAHLLAGRNPYLTPVADPGGGLAENFGYRANFFSYPPANLAPLAAARWLTGDVRHAYLAAEALAVAALWALARRRGATDAARLLPLLFLFHPRGLFEIEQAWTEPLLVGGLAAYLWLEDTGRRPTRAAVALGLWLSLKQYLFFFAALHFAQRRRWRELPLVAAAGLATWLPFLVWDAPSALANGLWFQLHTAFRPDGLTWAAAVWRGSGWEATKWVAVGAGLLVAAVAGRALRGRGLAGWLHAGLLATLAAFLGGSQAFCNYYYFLGAGVLLLLALRGGVEESFSIAEARKDGGAKQSGRTA